MARDVVASARPGGSGRWTIELIAIQRCENRAVVTCAESCQRSSPQPASATDPLLDFIRPPTIRQPATAGRMRAADDFGLVRERGVPSIAAVQPVTARHGSRRDCASSRRRASAKDSQRSVTCSTGVTASGAVQTPGRVECAGKRNAVSQGKQRCSIRRKARVLDNIGHVDRRRF